MRIFIDLGAFDGDTITMALNRYNNLDKIYAFEPLEKNFERLARRFAGRENIVLLNVAAHVADAEAKLYLGREWGDEGGSLCENKITCHKDKFENIQAIDFSRYIKDFFDDEIILKINIEGGEYELLEKMIRDGSINYVSELFCEWHYDKIGVSREEHQEYIKQLRRLGFNLTGDNEFDEFGRVWRVNNIRLQMQRYSIYYVRQLKSFLGRIFEE